MTDDEITALRVEAAKAPEGPWFVAPDDALGSPDHERSGLSMVETGRDDDWPIAQLCEWPTATYLAAIDPQTVLGLLDKLVATQLEITERDEDHLRDLAEIDRLRGRLLDLEVRLVELEIATTALVNIRDAGPRSTPQDLRNLAASALKHIEV